MPNILEQLLVEINGRTEGLTEDLRKSGAEVATFTRKSNESLGKLESGLSKVGGQLRSALGLFGVSLTATAFVRGISAAVEQVDSLAKAAKTADITAESLQELRYAFTNLADVTDEQVDVSLQRFNRRLGLAAEGGGPAKDSFNELGIAIRTAGGEMRDTSSVLDESLKALSGIEDASIRAAKASELFGEDQGPQLAAALGEGIEALETAKQRAQDLGFVLANELVASAEDAADQFADLKKLLGTEWQALVLSNIDTIERFATSFANLGTKALDAVDNIQELFGAMENQTTTDLRQELRQLQDVLENQRTILERTGVFKLGGKLQFFLSDDDLKAEMARIQAELEARAKPVGAAAGEALSEGAKEQIRTSLADWGFTGKTFDLSVRPKIELEDLPTTRAQVEKSLSDWGFTGKEIPIPASLDIKLDSLTDETKKMESQFDNFGESLGRSLEDSLADAFMGSEVNFGQMLRRMATQLAASQLLQFLGSVGAPPGSFNAFGAFLGFGGHRAGGGPVSAGVPYLVGDRADRKPEIFVPDVSGRILTMGQAMRSTAGVPKLVVHNLGAPIEQASVKQSGPDILELSIGATNTAFARGQFDTAMAARYGLRPKTGVR